MKRISWRLGGRHSDQLWSHLSQPVSALQPTEAVQSRRFRKTCVRPTILSIFIGCTAFWIWMNLVQVWLDLSKEACEEQEVEMDIIWNEENFMEARRPPQRPALKPFISAHVSLQQKRVFNLDASENLCETDNSFHFHRLHCVLNLDEFGSGTTRSFKRNMWRAGSGDGHHMEWREFHGGSAAATHSDQLWSHLSQPMSACSNSAVAPLIWTAGESDRGGVGCWISTLQWTSVTPAFNLGFHRFALGYDRIV